MLGRVVETRDMLGVGEGMSILSKLILVVGCRFAVLGHGICMGADRIVLKISCGAMDQISV